MLSDEPFLGVASGRRAGARRTVFSRESGLSREKESSSRGYKAAV
jgi:hypothetical protein